MINDDKYKEVLESGLLLDHYFLLCNIRNGIKPVETKRIQGFINLLAKKGYLEDGALTEKGSKLIENCEFSQVVNVASTKSAKDLGSWALGLHERLQQRLEDLTGKKQVRAKIQTKDYPFLPNPTDLGRTLFRVTSSYKLKDYDKIEKTLMAYIQKCNDAGNWFPLLKYFIMKNGESEMVTMMQTIDEESIESSKGGSRQKFV